MAASSPVRYIATYAHQGRIGVIVEFSFETSVPLHDKDLLESLQTIAMHIAAENPIDIATLLEQFFIRQPEYRVGQILRSASEKCSEEIRIRRFVRWDVDSSDPAPEDLPPKSPAVAMRVVK